MPTARIDAASVPLRTRKPREQMRITTPWKARGGRKRAAAGRHLDLPKIAERGFRCRCAPWFEPFKPLLSFISSERAANRSTIEKCWLPSGPVLIPLLEEPAMSEISIEKREQAMN